LSKIKKFIVLVVLVVIVASLVYFSPMIASYFQNSGYTKVVVPLGGSQYYPTLPTIPTQEELEKAYAFAWDAGFYNAIITVDPRALNADYLGVAHQFANYTVQFFPVTAGATYTMGSASSYYGGIEIKVSEIHSDYIVLLVKPL
jgi:hypothetical protein